MHHFICTIPLCMEHFIIVLHQHCNHAFQDCIIIRAIKHCTMGETFYLYSLIWWHCTGIKKHVLCNSSDNIIQSKDIPKTPPKPSFCFTLTCYSWALWWISMTLLFSCCGLCAARAWLPCLRIIPCFVWPFLLEQKILHYSIIYSTRRVSQELSPDVS